MSRAIALAAMLLLFLLYLSGLNNFGLIGPDEPRYASIGRAMAQSGDWVTPRLWGSPWFEKPALLYWMIGLAFRAGLGNDLSPRLPVAFVSIAFLLFFYGSVKVHFNAFIASVSTAILASSAMWLGYSHAAVTDIPLATAFCATILLLLPYAAGLEGRPVAGAVLLALSCLAKGLVPLVLSIPFLWFSRGIWRKWLRPWPIVVFLLLTVPWYAACALLNPGFLEVFFWQHQFGRFTSDALRHAQPFWFYLPVSIGAIFPWLLFIPFAFQRHLYTDRRIRLLGAIVLFGFIFFSVSTNKLPGYILPLLPCASIVMAAGIDSARVIRTRALSAITAFSCMLIPAFIFAAGLLPRALGDGIRNGFTVDAITAGRTAAVFPMAAAAAGASLLLSRGRALGLLFTLCCGAWIYIEYAALPWVEQTGSARSLWSEITKQIPESRNKLCVGGISRSWRYGLNYYTEAPLPGCVPGSRLLAIVPGTTPSAKPVLAARIQ